MLNHVCLKLHMIDGWSPLLFTLMTYDYVARSETNRTIKYADGATVVGLISKDQACWEEVAHLV